MKITKTAGELQKLIKDTRLRPVGFVPTMGALHKGHLSLVKHAVSKCPIVVVSIYVNPAQFNDPEDLKNYPRTIDTDLDLLKVTLREKDIVIAPDDNEIYPVPDNREFDFGNAGKIMEAEFRPGHFNGVARVVSRLFDIVRPDMAFFGMKDFQQGAVIREMVRQMDYNIKIEGLPTIREADGLAMSSRNAMLDPGLRIKAPVIWKTISTAASMLKDHDIDEIKEFVLKTINSTAGFKTEYFEIVDDRDLVPLRNKKDIEKDRHYFGCIAVRAGKIRLIDNIEFTLPVVGKVD